MTELVVAVVAEPLWHPVPGGTGRYTGELIAALDRRPDVLAFAVSAAHRDRHVPDLPPEIERRTSRLPRPLLYEAWSRSGRPGLERLVPEARVVHATTVLAPTADRRPLVATVHDLLFNDPRAGLGGRVRRLLARGWARTAEGAEVLVCPSRCTADAVLGAGVAPARVRVVAEGVRTEALDDRAVTDTARRLGVERPYVLWVGTVEPRKNLATVLAAFGTVSAERDHGLVVVGPDGWGPQVAALVAASPAPSERVTVLGRVDDHDLAGLYAGAEVLCWPSLAEGFGLPVLEAQAYGTPVVTSSGTAQAELVDDGGLLVDPTDAGAVAGALARLLDDEDERAGRGAAGRVTAARYTWERAAAETAEVYRDLAS